MDFFLFSSRYLATGCHLMKVTLMFFHLLYQHIQWNMIKPVNVNPMHNMGNVTTPLILLSPHLLDKRSHHCFCVTETSEISTSLMSQQRRISIFSSEHSLHENATNERPDEFPKKMPLIIVRREYQRPKLANFVKRLELMYRH